MDSSVTSLIATVGYALVTLRDSQEIVGATPINVLYHIGNEPDAILEITTTENHAGLVLSHVRLPLEFER